ncbi:MAG: hypothetical protein ABW252_06080 [Polyangiales bacterium]
MASDRMRVVLGLVGLLVAARTHAQEPPPPADPEPTALEARVHALEEANAALVAELAAQELAQSADRPSLRFYGFADFNLLRAWPTEDHPLRSVAPGGVLFALGNLNLYAAANLTHGVSSLFEVRFSYLPNGGFDAGGEMLSTTVTDYNDWYRPNRWGGIVLERAHVDYAYSSYLNFRIGSWKTPYGVWNVDHGSPTLIPVGKPYPVGAAIFPNRQMGLQLFGAVLLGTTTLGYHFTLSNGRGDLDYFDYDKNKAIGGRLFVSSTALGTLTVGVSAYGGVATQRVSLATTPGASPKIRPVSDDQYSELCLAADVVWQLGGLHLQGELIAGQSRYRESARRRIGVFGGLAGVEGFVPDSLSRGGYALVGYRFRWFEIMPYVLGEYLNRGYAPGLLLDPTDIGGRGARIAFGLNIRPIATVVVKPEFGYTVVPDQGDEGRLPIVLVQAAWVF